MQVLMSRRAILTCDVCKQDIDEPSGQFVDMSGYNVHTHISCFPLLSAVNLVELLGLRSITFGPEKVVLAHEPRKFRLHSYGSTGA